MIPITPEQYAAIGKVAVQSGVLEPEVEEYLIRLGHRPKVSTLGRKLKDLEATLPRHIKEHGTLDEFVGAVKLVEKLVDRRNAVMHGIWARVGVNALVPAVATGRKAVVSARNVAALAMDIRNARMLLLRLCNEYCPLMDGGNKCPHTLSSLHERLTGVMASGGAPNDSFIQRLTSPGRRGRAVNLSVEAVENSGPISVTRD